MNGRILRYCAAALLGASSLAWTADPLPGERQTTAPRFFAGGIQVHEPDHDSWTDTLGDVGLNTVAVTVYAMQGGWNRAHLWWEDEEPAVLDEIRTAKAKGLAVVLILRVAVDHAFAENQFIWHGMIMPGSHDEIRSWFEQYGRFVAKWARLAEQEGIDVLGVGSEMKSLAQTLPLTRWGNLKHHYGYTWYQRLSRKRAKSFSDELTPRHLWVRGYPNYATLEEFVDAQFEHTIAWADQAHLRPGAHTLRRVNERRRLINDCWIRLIRETREVYHGPLTYAANFDNYQNVGFWPQLDLMGINSYFSLRSNLREAADPQQQPAHFERRWAEILGRIRSFKESQGVADMPFLFTELGYTFRRHSTVEPWAHGGFSVVGWKGKKKELVICGEQPVDREERRLALEALRQVHRRGDDDFVGILYCKLSTDRTHEAIEPFVVHIGPDSADGLQHVLAGFGEVR